MSRVQRIVIRDDREITRAVNVDREITRVVNVGPKGAPGTGLRVDGVLSSTSQLPGGAATGDAYLVSGDLWVWSGTAWVNAGPVQGPKGDPGSDFLLLGDTPSSYAGRAGDLPVVNAAEDALEFRELGAAAKTMKVKTAAQLSGADYLLGHDAGSPAGMRTLLSSLVEFMTGKVESNANGSYVRLENGLQICWHKLPEATSNYATGPLYIQAPAVGWTYPAAFIAPPQALANVQYSAGSPISVSLVNVGPTSCGYQVWGASNTSKGHPQIVAIGRWH